MLISPLVLLSLALQSTPASQRSPEQAEIDVQRIEQLIVDNAPSSISSSGERALSLDQSELELLNAFALQNLSDYPELSTEFQLNDGNATVTISTPVRLLGIKQFLNLRAELRQTNESLQIHSITAGRLPIPLPLVTLLSGVVQNRLASTYVNYQEFKDLYQSIEQISFREQELLIILNWEPRLITRVQAQAEQFFLSAEDRERILSYYGQIVAIVNALPKELRSISLNTLLFPLFQTAQAKTELGADVYTENRAVLQSLSLYVNESDISTLVTNRNGQARPRQVRVTIQRREDLAQHFTSSAAITASVGAGVAGILSNSKEDYDARYRTGFSFSDLTANIAGVALGNAATADIETAQKLQALLAEAEAETDYMPIVARDYTRMSEQDFTEQYQSRSSDAYLQRLASINLEIAQLPIYQFALEQ
ncbi:MAG: hypothetical protein R3332_07815 [Pseudohongiellaceae bacterium]|nr:hypothetical protein [Pseudohongiellaceae bacterium]